MRGPRAPRAQPPLCVARAGAPPRPGFLQLCSSSLAARDPSRRLPSQMLRDAERRVAGGVASPSPSPQHGNPRPCMLPALCQRGPPTCPPSIVFLSPAGSSGGRRFKKERVTCFGGAGAWGHGRETGSVSFPCIKTRCVFWCPCSDRALAQRGGAVAGRRRGTPAAHPGEDDQVTGRVWVCKRGAVRRPSAPQRHRRSGHFARQINGRAEPEHLATVAFPASSRAM